MAAYFDVYAAGSLSLNDDWIYSWSMKRLAQGHGFEVLHDYGVLHAPQVLATAALTLGHYDLRLLRLTVMPFLISTSAAVMVLSRRLGANRFWAAVAAALPMTQPIALSVATGYMSDIFFLGLYLPALVYADNWIRMRSGRAICVAFTTAATLQRPVGVLIAPALSLALLWGRRETAVSTRDLLSLAFMWVAGTSAVLLPFWLGFDTAFPGGPTTPVQRTPDIIAGWVIVPLAALPAMIGLMAAPMILALSGLQPALSRLRSAYARGFLHIGGTAWLLVSVVGLLCVQNIWTLQALGPVSVGGTKNPVLIDRFGLEFLVAATICFPLMFLINARRSNAAAPPPQPDAKAPPIWRLPPSTVLLLGAALAQLLPMMQGGAFDRYFLAVVTPGLPILGALAGSVAPRRMYRVWAIGCIVGGLIIYGAGEQDYLAWETARDTAARGLYVRVAPAVVNAGYEANAVYAVLPYYEAHGTYPMRKVVEDRSPHQEMLQFLLLGPESAAFTLCFAPLNAPGDGVPYSSLASGRVAITAGGKCH